MHDFAADLSLGHIVDLALVDVGILVDDRYRIVDRIVVNLRFVVEHFKLHLGRILNGAAQFIRETIRATLKRIKRRMDLFKR
jgi:hypothetical protein